MDWCPRHTPTHRYYCYYWERNTYIAIDHLHIPSMAHCRGFNLLAEVGSLLGGQVCVQELMMERKSETLIKPWEANVNTLRFKQLGKGQRWEKLG